MECSRGQIPIETCAVRCQTYSVACMRTEYKQTPKYAFDQFMKPFESMVLSAHLSLSLLFESRAPPWSKPLTQHVRLNNSSSNFVTVRLQYQSENEKNADNPSHSTHNNCGSDELRTIITFMKNEKLSAQPMQRTPYWVYHALQIRLTRYAWHASRCDGNS